MEHRRQHDIDAYKATLLGMAETGQPKPAYKSNEGAFLSRFVSASTQYFDPTFSQQIRSLRPDWFKFDTVPDARRFVRNERTEAGKATIRQLAASGGQRPRQHHEGQLGRLLSGMTCPTSPYYDEEFDNELRALRPDWFKKSRHKSGSIKQALLDIARSGKPRPSDSRNRNALGHYTTAGCPSYDKAFAEEIKALRPEWFQDTRRSALIQSFYDAAHKGEPRPARLDTYIGLHHPCRDELLPALKKLRPDWFWGVATDTKLALLDRAMAGLPKPRQKDEHGLYMALRRYTLPWEKQYDEEFTQRLGKLRPDWLKRRSNRDRPAITREWVQTDGDWGLAA